MSPRRINLFIFDDLNRFLDYFTINSANEENLPHCEVTDLKNNEILLRFDFVINTDGYLLSVFHNVLSNSLCYRKLVKKVLLKTIEDIPSGRDVFVRINLVQPVADILDYGWNNRILKLLMKKKELESLMSWLSTLGGAFSALGDNFEHYAKIAEQVSVQQFQIALRLGDPPLVARCKLYMALSLIQQRKLKIAKKTVEEQFQLAKKFEDFRLINMCKGVWARLQYAYKLERLNKTS